MSLTVNSQIVANVTVASIELHPMAGAYELAVLLSLTPTPPVGTAKWLNIQGARILVRTADGRETTLGVARPDQSLRLRQDGSSFARTAQLALPLLPQQLNAIEDVRSGSDLHFTLTLTGEGGVEGQPGEVPAQDQAHYHMAQSAWIAKLRAARALDVLLLELPMPFADPTEAQIALRRHITSAQTHFANGHYREAVADCRAALECLSVSANALDALQTHRKTMTKQERLHAALAAIRHVTHIAHHATNAGGAADFDRAEAKLVLHLTVAAAAFA